MTKINYGFDNNFFTKVTISDTDFPDDPQITVNAKYCQGLELFNYGTNGTTQAIEYSFNGNVVHGELIPGTASACKVFDNRPCCQIWFRTASASTVVTVAAW